MKKKYKNRAVIYILGLVFISYNLIIYTQKSKTSAPKMSERAIRGEKIWQKNNCTACHQLYGLGGFLGPDLTNVISNPSKGPAYVGAFINSGIKSMPIFTFTEDEKKSIIAFLTEVDKTGHYPNTNGKINGLGWITLEYK